MVKHKYNSTTVVSKSEHGYEMNRIGNPALPATDTARVSDPH